MTEKKKEISMMNMLKAGVHFGHKKSKRHPKMSKYIFTVRNDISIIDLVETRAKLNEAVDFIDGVVSNGGVILFVGTKKQVKKIVKEASEKCNMPYVTERWLGGTFTNFEKISDGTKRLERMMAEKESGELKEKYTKKEIQEFNRELGRLEIRFGGIKKMKKLPDAIFVVDVKEEETAVKEAVAVGVPIVAIVDTNINPDPIDYQIPANDDAIRSVELITNTIVGAITDKKMKSLM